MRSRRTAFAAWLVVGGGWVVLAFAMWAANPADDQPDRSDSAVLLQRSAMVWIAGTLLLAAGPRVRRRQIATVRGQDGAVAAVSFGDNVRVVESPETASSGHANLLGVCWGFTTPAVTGVSVIGPTSDSEVALNVHFDDEGVPDAWFVPDLVELVDHAAGTRIVVGDADLLREADGTWAPPVPREPAGNRPRRGLRARLRGHGTSAR